MPVLEVELSASPSSNTARFHRRTFMTAPVVLITGALTGIGRATALAFAQEGARLVVSGRRDEAAGQRQHCDLSSTMGQRGAPVSSLYAASKHAVEGLTKSAALEGTASGIRVNAIAPGPVETELLNRFTGTAERKAGLVAGVPLKRAGTRAEIADAIVFVASRKASFITGQIINVNGGKTAS
jgi:NAD(P)-dependent dehydrogenase (short-subunit alcohol dehydrogenase family)